MHAPSQTSICLYIDYTKTGLLQSCLVVHGGAEGIRTLDPLIANQVLSQLSYNPVRRA